MDMVAQLNEVIEHIESHLLERNDYDALAKIACCSVYNLQRIFSATTSISISDYIRRRRISLAASEILNTDASILDIAIKYGYESPESFSRAFQLIYNISPAVMRKTKPGYTPFSRIIISVEVIPMDTMKFADLVQQNMEDIIGGIGIKVVRMDALKFIGKIKKDGMHQIKQFVDECYDSGFMENMLALQNNNRDFGVFINNADYMVAIEKPNITCDAAVYDEIMIPGSIWAVAWGKFDCENVNTPKYWSMIDQYLSDTEYVVDENIPIIEKFPDGAEPLDQTYMLMKPIRTSI